MQSMILLKMIFLIIGTILLIVLFPFVILGVIIVFCYNIIRTNRCSKCSKWFAGAGSICSTCTPVPVMLTTQEDGERENWVTLMDETVSRGMDLAFAVNEHGIWHIGERTEDIDNIEWKLLGRDM